MGGYVRSLTATLEEHDPSTGRHSRRVAALAVQVAEHMGLPPHRVRRLAIAGLVHDIGKLGSTPAILNKPGPLTDEEYEIVKEHPRSGAKLLRHLGGFDEEIAIVEAHHERWTGGGYPDGLSGDEHPARGADPDRLRRVRRAHREARLPRRLAGRACRRADQGRDRHHVRPGLRRFAAGRARRPRGARGHAPPGRADDVAGDQHLSRR